MKTLINSLNACNKKFRYHKIDKIKKREKPHQDIKKHQI